ncbi:MAG: hypothetical protein VZR24_13845 [Butyrivibrio hungatei]|nr:hypothetical protein [Butyrivibrio hungatei]
MSNYESIGFITKDTVIIQTFLCTERMINCITLYPGNFYRINKGVLNIQLVDQENGMVIKKWEYDVSRITLDQAIILKYDFYKQYDDMKGKIYKLVISGECLEDGTTLTLFKNLSDNAYDNTELWLDGVIQEGTLKCKVSGVSDKVYYGMVKVLIYLYLLIGAETAWKLHMSCFRKNREIKI